MYFEIEDYRPDITPVGSAISWREGVLLSIIAHLSFVIVLLLFPKLFSSDANARARELLARQQAEKREPARFVFVAPRLDQPAPRPPQRAEPSDQDRLRRTPERAPKPTNPLPVMQVPVPNTVTQPGANGRVAGGGSLGEAFRNLQRYIPQEQFNNPGGSSDGRDFGPLQFDTKGVEFGPWVRRFIAQVKRNWIVPYAAMSMKGHVVITFYVHKDGSLTDVNVIGPCPIEPFNNAAFGALSASNPTVPLPPEYPTEKAFFTVTFFYNETPP